jgi:plastocyanin
MRLRAIASVLLGTAATPLALPVAAQATTKVVFMGTPPEYAKTVTETYQSQVDDFLPHHTTIRVGDRIRFLPVGLHSVDLPARGGSRHSLLAPTGRKVAHATDAGGSTFWFNGQDVLGVDPALLTSAFGKSLTYDTTTGIESGLSRTEEPKPMTVTFTRAGQFTFYCDVHPGMKGTVRVAGPQAKVPSVKAHRRTIDAEMRRDLKIIKKLAKRPVVSRVVNVGVAGRHGTEYLGFLPSDITVPAGGTVKFRMSPGSVEDHTATTGPGDPLSEPESYLGTLAKSYESPVFDPAAVYPSEPPGTVTTYTPTLHGNGFWSSGLLDTSSSTSLPRNASVTFTEVGSYTFYCLLHPFMRGTVTVD